MTLTVGSLFSGIGGLDLGLERAGMRVVWQSEIDPYCSKVLKKHWPEVPNLGDIKEIDWSNCERPDVICGGYPCQPFSTAGKRQGNDDPRHLWPWVREAISVLRPRFAILENVRGHLSMGGLSVIGELASIGYDAEWRIVSAASVGANHKRDRLFIVAYPDGSHSPHGRQRETVQSKNSSWGNDRRRSRSNTREIGLGSAGQIEGNVAHTASKRLEAERPQFQASGSAGNSKDEERSVAYASSCSERNEKSHGLRTIFGEAPKLREPSSPARSIPNWWEIEPDVGRVAHGVPDRMDRLKGLGNAVVPQVAEVIGRLVMEASWWQ